jgi:hypothetical protein
MHSGEQTDTGGSPNTRPDENSEGSKNSKSDQAPESMAGHSGETPSEPAKPEQRRTRKYDKRKELRSAADEKAADEKAADEKAVKRVNTTSQVSGNMDKAAIPEGYIENAPTPEPDAVCREWLGELSEIIRGYNGLTDAERINQRLHEHRARFTVDRLGWRISPEMRLSFLRAARDLDEEDNSANKGRKAEVDALVRGNKGARSSGP